MCKDKSFTSFRENKTTVFAFYINKSEETNVPNTASTKIKKAMPIKAQPKITHENIVGIPGLEPRITGPESVVLPITPYPNHGLLQIAKLRHSAIISENGLLKKLGYQGSNLE